MNAVLYTIGIGAKGKRCVIARNNKLVGMENIFGPRVPDQTKVFPARSNRLKFEPLLATSCRRSKPDL